MPQVFDRGHFPLVELSLLSFEHDLRSLRIVLLPFSRVSHPNFSNPQHHNLLPLLYFLVGGVIMMTESTTRVWDPPILGLKWSFRSIALFLHIKSVSEVGPIFLTLRGMLSKLCLIPVKCSDICSSLGLLVSLAEVMALNIGLSPNLPILEPSIILRICLLISSTQLWNRPTTFPTTISPPRSHCQNRGRDHGFVLGT